MTSAYPMPDASKIRAMLGLLFEGLEVRPIGRSELKGAAGSWLGLYIADSGAAVAACVTDAALAAYASSALSMLPPSIARTAAESKELNELMVENLREVLNICTRLLMHEGAQHLRLEDIYPAQAVPSKAATLLGAPKARIDFELTIPKYGPGSLAVVST